ncbi:disulfide bond formation protein DsbB [Halogranum gelatinilyticum]|uniref:Disulfide bond formation protein DsbB n=1 Tax=Halogranum gelatinilyticum TaxID=660521 RepID=A0A1G9STD6_9EURY|nr:disulfide bond formation protein B [Halogranum gelatinilyticum]SDM38702.1 disulfide bond formation protein DsbB [Halogranum gelatinilyticum]
MIQSRLVLAVSTFVASVATAGSLYFSLGLGLVPCELCWYQRILMYPLVVVLGVATLDGNSRVWRTGLPLSLLGMGIAAYHSYLQINPSIGATCGVGGGCASILYPMAGGLLTIPRLSLVGFVLVTACLLVLWRQPTWLEH